MTPTVPGIRILPVPESEPPCEQERTRAVRESSRAVPDRRTPGVQGSFALAFELPSGAAATPHPPAPTGRDETIVRQHAAKFAQAFVEVLAGMRPVTQLLQWTTPEVYDSVRHRAAAPGGWPGDTSPRRARVHSVRVCRPHDGITEVCAVVGGGEGERSHAMALRLEGTTWRWRCTELELG